MTTAEYIFRYDAEMSVLWAGDRSYPATFWRESAQDHIPADDPFRQLHPDYRMESRQATVHFENQWCLSVIWGDSTWSSNSWMHLSNPERAPFVEEPMLVEVGVLMPTPIHHEAKTYGPLPSGQSAEMPAYETYLWGDPLGYVTVPEFHRVADLVMMLPTEIDLPGGEWDDAQGFCDFLVTAGLDRAMSDDA